MGWLPLLMEWMGATTHLAKQKCVWADEWSELASRKGELTEMPGRLIVHPDPLRMA